MKTERKNKMEEGIVFWETAEATKKQRFKVPCKLCYDGSDSEPLPYNAGEVII